MSIEPLIIQYGIFIVAFLVFINEVGVPTGLPVEIALLLAGAFAIHSVPELVFAIALVTAADVLGAGVLYLLARTGGTRLLDRVVKRFGHRGEEMVQRWRTRLGGHDVGVIAFGRALPLVRMYVSIGAGLLRLRGRDFVIGATPGAALWGGIPILLGYLFHADVNRLAAEYASLSHWGFAAMPVFSLIVFLLWWIRRGGSGWMQLRRGRLVLSLVVATIAGVFLVRLVALHGNTVEAGMVAFGRPLLAPWLLLLAGLAAALVNAAIGDLRAAWRRRETHPPFAHPLISELVTTLLWVSIVAAVGAIMFGLQMRYPVL